MKMNANLFSNLPAILIEMKRQKKKREENMPSLLFRIFFLLRLVFPEVGFISFVVVIVQPLISFDEV